MAYFSFTEIPSNPVFSLPVAVEGSESQITCSATRGRPAPYIKFIYNNTFENFTNTKIFDEDTRTYNVTSTFHRTLYRWDNRKQLRCCYEHDLIRGRIGCDTLVTLNVKCMYDRLQVYNAYLYSISLYVLLL